MASPTETPSWDRKVLCGCKGCAVARKPLQDAIQRVRELAEKYGNYGSVQILETDFKKEILEALDGEQ